jgi:uncharacterized RDD family membrane protein YckC
MTNEAIELETVPYDKTMYPRVIVRLGAVLLDLLVTAPFGILVLYLNSFSKDMYLFTFIPSVAFSAWYHVYLLKRYGGTPGKLLSGIRVVKINGQDPEWKEAFLRYALSFSLLVFGTAISLIALSKADPGSYMELDWRNKAGYLKGLAPGLFKISLWLNYIVIGGDLIVLFRNRRKRALHDLMAGTVVVRDLYMTKLRLNQLALADTQE